MEQFWLNALPDMKNISYGSEQLSNFGFRVTVHCLSGSLKLQKRNKCYQMHIICSCQN